MKTKHYEPVFVITGAGKGIGEALILEIIARKESISQCLGSPRLLIAARTQSDLINLQTKAIAAGIPCEICPSDLTTSPTLPITQAVKAYGQIDILIHSAGVGRFKNFLDLTEEDLNFTVNTNVNAAFLLMQSGYAQMKKQKSGHIVFITSVAADKPFKESAIYCMSKYAQKGLLDVMRIYGYEDQIKITEVKPGAVATPMWGDVPAEMKAKMMPPADIARSILDAILLPSSSSVEEITLRPLQGDFV